MQWIILSIVVLLVLGLLFAVLYNKLLKKRNYIHQAKGDLAALLKRRFNLIPNLVETVKGYAKHERETLDSVVKARGAAMSAVEQGDAEQVAQTENMLSQALKSIFALAENYPDLKASANFVELQRELTDTEDKIVAGRRFLNNSLREYNTLVHTIPYNLVAPVAGFRIMDEYYRVNAEEAAPVKVNF